MCRAPHPIRRKVKLGQTIALALVIASMAWPATAADHYWECTKSDGVRYWDASQCDKGDRAVKVNKADRTSLAKANRTGVSPEVCPANPDHCALPDYGVEAASPRAYAIAEFMRKKQCELMKRFPERCAKPR